MSEPFRRRISFTRRDDGTVDGVLEDHVHHFEVTITTHDGVVAAIEGRAVRAPWSMCPGAAAVLEELVGAPVGVAARPADPTQHCTHLLDLAVMAVRFAGADVATRRYDAVVEGWDEPPSRSRVQRDDGAALEWEATGTTITAPAPFAGRSLGAGFTAWVTGAFDADTAEMALVLRRATWMSMVRGIDLDEYERLSDMLLPRGSCFAAQPHRIERARRNRGSSLPSI